MVVCQSVCDCIDEKQCVAATLQMSAAVTAAYCQVISGFALTLVVHFILIYKAKLLKRQMHYFFNYYLLKYLQIQNACYKTVS